MNPRGSISAIDRRASVFVFSLFSLHVYSRTDDSLVRFGSVVDSSGLSSSLGEGGGDFEDATAPERTVFYRRPFLAAGEKVQSRKNPVRIRSRQSSQVVDKAFPARLTNHYTWKRSVRAIPAESWHETEKKPRRHGI